MSVRSWASFSGHFSSTGVGQAWCWAPGNGVTDADGPHPHRACTLVYRTETGGSNGEELGEIESSLPREKEASEESVLA